MGKLGVPLTGSFGLLPRETGSIPAAVRERYLLTGYGPGNVCHRTGDPSSTGIQRHGQTRPGLDDQGMNRAGVKYVLVLVLVLKYKYFYVLVLGF